MRVSTETPTVFLLCLFAHLKLLRRNQLTYTSRKHLQRMMFNKTPSGMLNKTTSITKTRSLTQT